MFSRSFLLATVERTVKTFAEVLGAQLVANASGILDVHWADALSVSGLAALLAVLACVASGSVGSNSGPSLAGETLAEPVPPVIPLDQPQGDAHRR